jgi:hypothetical protein
VEIGYQKTAIRDVEDLRLPNPTTHELEDLTNLYHEFEETINLIPVPADDSLKTLVTFETSKDAPVHRWYTFKEGYSNKLLSSLERYKIIPRKSGKRLLDPFCGVATTLLSCQIPGENGHIRRAVGVERNPAIYSIAKAKLNWPHYRSRVVSRIINELKAPKRGRRSVVPPIGLSTLTARKNGKQAFEQGVLDELIFYRNWIRENCHSQPELDFFMLAWTSIIEPVSNTRKDGRALRLLDASQRPNVKQLLLARCELMLEDLSSLNKQLRSISQAEILAGDGRSLPFRDGSFTALCYSPPYLNNIDYSEVYKLELWLRGDIADQHEFRSLRLGTLRSHPSVKFPATTISDHLSSQTWIRRLKGALIAALPSDSFRKMRETLFCGYLDDMLVTLREQKRVAVPGAPIVCVVGNSLHGGKDHPSVPVCTDLLISAAARAVGLEIDHVQIARQLPRRDHKNGWLRESIVVMRKRNKAHV